MKFPFLSIDDQIEFAKSFYSLLDNTASNHYDLLKMLIEFKDRIQWYKEKQILNLVQLRYIDTIQILIYIFQRYIKKEEIYEARKLYNVIELIYPNNEKVIPPLTLLLLQEEKYHQVIEVIYSLPLVIRNKKKIIHRLNKAKEKLAEVR